MPYLGCLNTLIYRSADPDLGTPGLTSEQLLTILGVSPDTSPKPPPGAGLLVDFTGGTTDACLYLQTVMENAGYYPTDPALPPATQLDPTALADLQRMVAIAGRLQAAYQDESGYDRVNWFAGGLGRAFVGLTETLASFTNAEVASLAFIPLPVASAPVSTIPLFTDALAINRSIDPAKVGLATELINLIAATTTFESSVVPSDQDITPQYLTPVRMSALNALAMYFPVYAQIREYLTQDFGTAAFRIGVGARSWLTSQKAAIAAEILGAPVVFDESLLPADYRSTPAGLWRRR